MLPDAAKIPQCREIEIDDFDGVVECLSRNFPDRDAAYWRDALAVLAARTTVLGLPRFGHLLDVGGRVVGVLLTIHSQRGVGAALELRCNLSSWCVDPEWRFHSLTLHKRSTARPDVLYLNVSAAPHTRPVIEAMGFRKFTTGQVLFAPLGSRPRKGRRAHDFEPAAPWARALPQAEHALLVAHAARGCRAVVVDGPGGVQPFVFQMRRILKRTLPCGHLIYARGPDALAADAHALGRLLLRSGVYVGLIDANGPITGLVGRYFVDREIRYFKGAKPPVLGDLADTELVVLGP